MPQRLESAVLAILSFRFVLSKFLLHFLNANIETNVRFTTVYDVFSKTSVLKAIYLLPGVNYSAF